MTVFFLYTYLNQCAQQPPTEKVQISVKIWVFDDPFHKNRPVLVIWLSGGIQPSEAVIFLMKCDCKGH